MVWLIVTAVILGVIFEVHAYAAVSSKAADEDRPFSQPTIFLADKPSPQPMKLFEAAPSAAAGEDLSGNAIKKPLLLSDKKSRTRKQVLTQK